MMRLETWEEAKVILREYAWIEHLCTVPCRAFWEDSDKYIVWTEVFEAGESTTRSDEDLEVWLDPQNTSHLYGPNLPLRISRR